MTTENEQMVLDAFERGKAFGFAEGLRQQAEEIEALHKLVKEQDMKIINLAFDLEYAKWTDEWLKETDEQVITNAEKRFPFLKKASEK